MTDYVFVRMDIATAREIADGWNYEVPYDFYNATADPEDYEEFVDPNAWPELFFAARSEGELCGFFSVTIQKEGAEIGLGMRPDLAGQGNGVEFVDSCIKYAKESCGVAGSLVLNVATFNERAIRVYERVGFVVVGHYKQATNGAVFDFV